MKPTKWATTALVLLLATGSVWATGDGKYGEISAYEVKKRTEKLLKEVPWHKDFDVAMAAAQEADKPLLWIQMVGDLDGGL